MVVAITLLLSGAADLRALNCILLTTSLPTQPSSQVSCAGNGMSGIWRWRTVLRHALVMSGILHRSAPIRLEPLVADAVHGTGATKVW
jgi:hypothetical protein